MPNHPIDELNVIAKSFINRSIAASTHRQYSACLTRYVKWCFSLNLQAFPVCLHNLILFVSDLATKSFFANIKVHVSAIKFFSLINGYMSFQNYNRLYLTMRGIKGARKNKFKKPKRTPITLNILKEIKLNLFNSSYVFEDKLMIWGAMMLAFFGFLRVSEYTAARTQSFDPESTLCFNDITVNHLIHVKIISSKTDPFGCGVDIRLAPNGSSLCPVEALKQFMAIHPTKSGPLFTFQSGRYLTKNDISKIRRDLYPTCITSISSHSFRISAATTAAYMGHPHWLIQKLGRWTSDCFREYIRVPDNTIYSVSKSLVNHPHSAEVYDPDLS